MWNIVPYEVAYVIIGNPTFCLLFNLTGVQFWGELHHVGHVGERKIKCWPIRTHSRTSTVIVLFNFSCFKWSMKKCPAGKILHGIWERFLYENDRKFNSYKFSYNLTFIPFPSFHRNQKQQSNFQEVDGLV